MTSAHLQDRTFQDVAADFYGRKLSADSWSAKFGLHPAGFHYIWDRYCAPSDLTTRHSPHLCPKDPLVLLQAISHLREYRKESAAALDWRISKPTYRKRWQDTIWYLALNLDEVLRSRRPEPEFADSLGRTFRRLSTHENVILLECGGRVGWHELPGRSALDGAAPAARLQW
jgi:hypothetical protein